jgi:hypothetical protein
MLKYLRCPFNDKTVPTQFFALIFNSLGSGKLRIKILLYHSSPRSNDKWLNNNVLFFLQKRLIKLL